MKKILITGGAGYIGSHTAVELIKAGFEPIILDDFSNSQPSVIQRLNEIIGKELIFYKGDCNEKRILEKVIKHDLQAVQLHGKEKVEYCSELKSKLNVNIEIIKVFSILDDFNFDVLKPFESVADFFLFDTKGKLPGGNGTTFDWTVLEKYPSQKPFFLSGGIGLDEMDAVTKILKTNLPIYALDLNSKLEIEPGSKNVALCSAIVKQIRTTK